MFRLIFLLKLFQLVLCQENTTSQEETALFYRMENTDAERDKETDESVQKILSWLQTRYRNIGERKARTNNFLSNDLDSATMEPRPFGFNDINHLQDISSTEAPTVIETTTNYEYYPPIINYLNVECQKDKMTVDIQFDKDFNGIIYSKDHYSNPECRYVVADSKSSRYRFTIQLSACGTQFFNGFQEGGQSYMENVLVIQNEPGIVEAWDSVRSVRCQWEGRLNQKVTSGLSVVTPSTELVTFSGDTASARLEIQTGKGPFNYAKDDKPANIGDMMTLVITVDGDPEHMIRVGRCKAEGGGHEMLLSDEAGCPTRPKIMTAFEYTRNPETNGAMAYAYFRAFKFPDSNELNFDCNVELCKSPCVPCQDPNKGFHRMKRSTNSTETEIKNEVMRIKNKLYVSSPVVMHAESPLICLEPATVYMTILSAIMILVFFIASTIFLNSRRSKT